MKTLLIGLSLLFATNALAQHLEGEVTVDLTTGLFQCRLMVSGAPPLSDYKILLNHGMNIQYFKNGAQEMIPYE